jgi:hypothetical protein
VTIMKALITRHPVATYFALTFTISWGGVLLAVWRFERPPGKQAQVDWGARLREIAQQGAMQS